MTIRVSEAIDSDTAEKILVTRSNPSSRNADDETVPGTTFEFYSLASVQQPTAKQLEILSEGERSNDYRLFISIKPLLGVDEKSDRIADVVTYKGLQYKIVSPQDWDTYGHTTAIGARIQ